MKAPRARESLAMLRPEYRPTTRAIDLSTRLIISEQEVNKGVPCTLSYNHIIHLPTLYQDVHVPLA